MGPDSGWKTIVAGGSHFLALKQDGSLWGYGENTEGQLGPGPENFTTNFVRIGSDTNWVNVFALADTSFGVKNGGSVWRWGHFNFDSRGQWIMSSALQRHPEPELLCQEGTNWISLLDLYPNCLVLRKDGTVWATVPANELNIRGPKYPVALVPVKSHLLWTDMVNRGYGSLLSGLTTDGNLVVGVVLPDLSANSLFDSGTWQPSRYSDWIAIDAWGPVALAADGTLSGWRYSEWRGDRLTLLGPSRKPLWTLNVLTGGKK
jgi:hypothetical protein